MTKERATESPRDSAGRRLNRRFRANRHRGRRRDRRKEQTSDCLGRKRTKQSENGPNRPLCASEEPETRPPGRRLQRRRTPKSWATQSTWPGSGVRSKRPTEKRPRVPRHVNTTASTDAQISEWSAKPRLSRPSFSFQRAPCSPHKLSRDHEASETRKPDRHALHWTLIPLPRKFPFGKVANFTQRTPPGPL